MMRGADREVETELFAKSRGRRNPQISKDSGISTFGPANRYAVVLGPKGDGGYYLLGPNGAIASLDRKLLRRPGKRFGKALNILKNQTLSYLSLDAFSDVDTVEDQSRLRHPESLKHLGIR
jgi:glycosyltransferase A (GT-A) superfamily protein (DUF2064 family)